MSEDNETYFSGQGACGHIQKRLMLSFETLDRMQVQNYFSLNIPTLH